MPKISICVPNRNTRPYLPERFASIFAQEFQDWELIVNDSYSTDGAWEYIQELAATEPRMRIAQSPPEGPYAGFNACIKQARGEFIYIATSDDTMMPDCLAKMVAALEAHPDCGLCQCQLVVIDEKSIPFPSERQWPQYTLGAYDKDLVLKKNKRMAPHDGMVHPALYTICTSVTQLLVRRSVFDRIGLFNGQWGSISDFEWGMRAGLLENCIYIPDKLATWRLHTDQATQEVHTPKNRLKMIDMAYAAFTQAKKCGGASLENIDIKEVIYFLQRDVVELGRQLPGNKIKKLSILVTQFFQRPGAVVDYMLARLQGKKWGNWDCPVRYARLHHILQKYHVPVPIFE